MTGFYTSDEHLSVNEQSGASKYSILQLLLWKRVTVAARLGTQWSNKHSYLVDDNRFKILMGDF